MHDESTMSSRYYVYILLRPDGRAIYVGKGTGDRVLAHEAEAARGCTCYKCRAIRKVWRSGRDIQRTIVFRTDDEDAAYEYERNLIAEIGLENLCNIAEGGRVPPSLQTMLEQRERLAAQSAQSYGSIYRRKTDGRMVGSLTMYTDNKGKVHRRVVYGKSYTEVEAKLEGLRNERDHVRMMAKVNDTAINQLRRYLDVFPGLTEGAARDLIDVVEYCRNEYLSMKVKLEALQNTPPEEDED